MYGDSTPSEAQILKNLSQKKQIIENKQEEIETKQSALKSTEKRIDDKLVQLKKTQSDVEAYLEKHRQQESLKIKSLVKIYENMRLSTIRINFTAIKLNGRELVSLFSVGSL
jgi:peptidoglycan hydrolase CwlO-like protein